MFDYSDWQPIQDLPSDWKRLAHPGLRSLGEIWRTQAASIRKSNAYGEFLGKLRRRAAIETGIIERLYTIDRGITHLLVERGVDEALIPHNAVGDSPATVVALIRSQESAIQSVFDFVGGSRTLSTSYIKELHALLTEHQITVEKQDQFGKVIRTNLLRGDWKRFPNNPQRDDGVIHLYCPPEQTASQMEQLIAWHHQHMQLENPPPPEVEAAWLHHRFTQIHPFEDGNGRVARLLASLVFIRAGWFPLIISGDEEREPYIVALETADNNGLDDLVNLFAQAEQKAFIQALSLAEQAMAEQAPTPTKIIEAVAKKLRKEKQSAAERQSALEQIADSFQRRVQDRFQIQQKDITLRLYELAPDLRLVVSAASSHTKQEQERANYNRYQIVEIAKKYGYYANFSGYKSWVKFLLNRENGSTETEILVSFHILGREYRGVITCTACAYHKDEAQIQDLQPLSDAPFQLTEYDESGDLSKRFEEWLESILTAGLKFWYDSI